MASPRAQRIMLALLSALATIALVEGGSRLALRAMGAGKPPGMRFARTDMWEHENEPYHREDPELFWTLVPGYVRGDVRINRLGLRGPELLAEKPPDVYRIVLLGDSVTFGFRVAEHETYAARLETHLNGEHYRYPRRGFEHTQVLNAGVTGYSSWQGRKWYEALASRFAPALVIVMFGYNDHHSATATDREKSAERSFGGLLRLVRRSAAFRLVTHLLASGPPALRTRPVARVSVPEYRDNVLAIARAVERDGARALFLTVPLRPTIPLVENFRRIVLDDGEVWLRQLDFALGALDPTASRTLALHFVGTGDLRPFTEDLRNCRDVFTLRQHRPDLPIFHYLASHCHAELGDAAAAAAAMTDVRRTDDERREVEAYNEALRRLAGTADIEVLDVAHLLLSDGEDADVFLDVVHPGPPGHDRIARIIAERLAVSQLPTVRRDRRAGDAGASSSTTSNGSTRPGGLRESHRIEGRLSSGRSRLIPTMPQIQVALHSGDRSGPHVARAALAPPAGHPQRAPPDGTADVRVRTPGSPARRHPRGIRPRDWRTRSAARRPRGDTPRAARGSAPGDRPGSSHPPARRPPPPRRRPRRAAPTPPGSPPRPPRTRRAPASFRRTAGSRSGRASAGPGDGRPQDRTKGSTLRNGRR